MKTLLSGLGPSLAGRYPGSRRAGIALVPAILIVSGLAIFSMALLTAVLSGSRTVVHQNEEYQVSSAVESVAVLSAENLWSRYVAEQGGAAGDIASFRDFLTAQGIEVDTGTAMPRADEGKDLLPDLALPGDADGSEFDHVNVDAVRVVRRDTGDSTQLFLTVSASTTRGEGFVNPVLNRAVQQVYTVEPAEFPGFEYALLANNVNCIFCHTRVDNAERWWNTLGEPGTYERVKVGTLESLMLRHDNDGLAVVNDADADSFVAGSLYVRGLATESDGTLITDWNAMSLKQHPFDSEGHIQEDAFGLGLAPFAPAGEPPGMLESLYLDYPLAYADQVDGYLPDHFPSPFADDGGFDPLTGAFDDAAAGNKQVDDCEFLEVAASANGEITAGIVNITMPGETIDSAVDYADALFVGNRPTGLRGDEDGTGQGIQGNVMLTGWADNPIRIDGNLAIDGDLVIQGFVKGTGSIYVRGNVYVPADLLYADGRSYLPGDTPGHPTGPRTFGIAADGTPNALALTAGGNIVLGDYLRPASLQPDLTTHEPGAFEIIDGTPADDWNFPLSEMALFNRSEWAKTQTELPGASGPVPNPGHVPGYVPRYYAFGDGTIVPIYNQGGTFFDPVTGTWLGAEAPISWNPSQLTYADPANPSDPILFNPDGSPRAVVKTLLQADSWMTPSVYKMSIEYFETLHPANSPMLVDGLLYTNNAIFGIVYRNSAFSGMMLLNGAIVAADVGLLVPGKRDIAHAFPNHSPISNWAIGLQLNYDARLKKALSIRNPFQVQLKRTFWNPTSNLL